MLDMALFVNGIQAMADNCPSDGNVSVTFTVKQGNVKSVRLSKTHEMFNADSKAEDFNVEFFNDELKHRILKDTDNLRLQYGTITISIDTESGKLKNYSIIPSFTLNANLLAAEMRSQKNRKLAKERNLVA